jgi:hypothetical protein
VAEGNGLLNATNRVFPQDFATFFEYRQYTVSKKSPNFSLTLPQIFDLLLISHYVKIKGRFS